MKTSLCVSSKKENEERNEISCEHQHTKWNNVAIQHAIYMLGVAYLLSYQKFISSSMSHHTSSSSLIYSPKMSFSYLTSGRFYEVHLFSK